MTTATTPTPKQVLLDSERYAATFLKIRDKNGNLIRLRHNAAQHIYMENRTWRDYIVKARQLGFSTAILGDHFRIASTRSASITTITDDDKNTQRFRRRVDRFYDNLPENLRPPRKYANATVSTYPATDAEWSIVTAGNREVGRSGTNTHIHGSEVAFWADPQAIMRGLMQAGNPAIALETTPNGAFGYAYELAMETLGSAVNVPNYFIDGDNGWRLFFFPWWVNPEYRAPVPADFTPDSDDKVNQWHFTSEAELMARHGLTPAQIMWRRQKIRELKSDFIQEYPEDPITCFIVSGSAYFGDIRNAFTVPLGSRTYDPSHDYYAGMDFGQEDDYTVVSIIDATALEEVDIYRARREPWGDMRKQAAKLCKRWHVKVLNAEKNSMGSTNIEELRKELKSEGVSTHVNEFTMSNPSKADISVAMRDAIHEKGLQLLNYAIQRQEMLKYVRTRLPGGGWRFEGVDEHDDTVIAVMLAHDAMGHSRPPARRRRMTVG